MIQVQISLLYNLYFQFMADLPVFGNVNTNNPETEKICFIYNY